MHSEPAATPPRAGADDASSGVWLAEAGARDPEEVGRNARRVMYALFVLAITLGIVALWHPGIR